MLHITRNLSVCPLVDITDPDFEHQYQLGVWWAIYGDEQGKGKYDDKYLMENIELLLRRCFELSHLGFYLGMIHGGYLVASGDLPNLTPKQALTHIPG
jgi:hypothetical protein